jgi:hypothetical protein
MSKLDTSRIARFVWRVEFIPYVVFSAIGIAILYVLGGIGLNALHNGSLIPPPTKLERYDCTAPAGNFSLYYLHGTDRVQIKTANGLLDGNVQNNRFDWQGFGNDRSLLGFAPPSEIAFEDGRTVRVSGADLKEAVCTNTVEATAQRRAISQ